MIISPSELTQILTVLASVSFFPASAQLTGENDDCQLLESTVPIVRHMSVTHRGRPMNVMCTGDVSLKKCEGTCESSVSPSVRTHPGFKKDCRCCKETSTEIREVMLTSCFRNGVEVPDFQQPITVKEITGCLCQSCNA